MVADSRDGRRDGAAADHHADRVHHVMRAVGQAFEPVAFVAVMLGLDARQQATLLRVLREAQAGVQARVLALLEDDHGELDR
jgi:hypothetical protein